MKKLVVFFVTILSSIQLSAQFKENAGQVQDENGNLKPEVLFTYQESNAFVFFEKERIVFKFMDIHDEALQSLQPGSKLYDSLFMQMTYDYSRVDLEFENASKNLKISTQDQQSHFTNYFLSNNRRITNVKSFSSLTYENVYSDIDIKFYEKEGGLKYDIILGPNANIEDIKLFYNGASRIEKEGQGLKIHTPLKVLEEQIPLAYIEGELENEVSVDYQINNGRIQFISEAKYTTSLTIDPTISWCTYFERSSGASGTVNYDYIETDASGNLFFVSTMTSGDYPIVNPGGGAHNQSYGSGQDMYIAKFDPNRALVWATYLGGSSGDAAYGTDPMAIHGNTLHLVGQGSTGFPFTNGGGYYQTSDGPDFYARINKNTGAIQHCTYITGHSINHPSIDVSSTGQVLIGFHTYSFANPPIVNRAGAYNQATNGGFTDLYFMMLNSSYNQIWGTFLGGPGTVDGLHFAFDNNDNIFFVADASFASNGTGGEHMVNPGGGAYFQTTAVSEDMMIGKFNTNGALVWNTLYGGNAYDGIDSRMGNGSKISIHPTTNEVIITGGTNSDNLPLVNLPGAYNISAPTDTDPSGGSFWDFNSVILKFSNNGVLNWATYWGDNTGGDLLYGSEFLDCEKLMFFARSTAMTGISVPGRLDNPSGSQAFLWEVDINNYSPDWSSYLGNNTQTPHLAYAMGTNRLFVGLRNYDAALPVTNPGGGAYYDGVNNSTSNSNYSFWELNIVPGPTLSNTTICSGNTVTLSAGGGIGAPYNWYTSASGGSPIHTGSSFTTPTLTSTTTYYVSAGSGICVSNRMPVTVTVIPSPDPSWTSPGTVCEAAGNINLNSLITGTTGGSWSGTGVSGSTFNPSGLSGSISITYTVGTLPCQATETHSIVVAPDVNPAWTSPGTICETSGNINLNSLISGTSGGTWSGTGVSGSTFNPTGLSGSITVTYTVGTAPCQESSAQSITVNPDVNPVWSPSSPVCEAAGNINLNSLLGSATTGGTWSGTGVTGSTFNPSGLSGAINITYTVGTAPCQETSTQSITVISDVSPAWTSPGTICEANGNINLNSLISGTSGGTWSGTGVSGSTFNPTGLSGAISITYTVGTAPCQESSAQNITVNPDVNAVWTTPGTICESNGSINLNSHIGSATSGGTWSGTGVTGNNFDPSGLSGNIAITYTVGTAPCQETSTQNINVSPDVDPSWTDPSPVCESGGNVNLNGLITGTPGGSWSGTGVSGNNFDPSGLSGSISITYTVGSGACQETSTIMVSITSTPNPAWTSPGTICEAAGTLSLNPLITGTSGGTWSGTGVSGTNFDPTGLSGSVSVTYTVGTGACQQTSTQGITVTPDVDPNWTNPGTVCDGAGTVNLNGLITGTPGGTWSGTGVSGSTFDPSGLNGQTIAITYTVGTAPCVETSVQNINVQSAVTATWTNPGTICGGGGSIDLSTYITGSTGGTFSGSGVTGNMFDPSALSGNVTITYSVGSGVCSDMQAQTINVIPDVDPTWTNPSPVCIGSGVIDLNTLVTGTTGGVWSGTGVTGSNFDPAGLGGQTILITYLVGTAPCQEQSVLNVNVTNTVSAAWNAPATVCESDAVIDLSTLITGDPGGTWSGTGVTGSNFDPAGLSGNINITYTVGTVPCQDVQMSTVNVLSAPIAPTVSSINDTICEGDTTSIIASGSGTGITYEIYDAMTGGTNLGQAPLVMSPSSTTTYYIEAVNSNNCANIGGRVPVTIVVEALPIADAGTDQTVCPGDVVNLLASGGTGYNWDHGDMTAASTITATSTQYYYVTVSNANCSARDSVLITVNTPGTVTAVNDNANGTSGDPISTDVSANDSGDPNTVSIINGPFNGTANTSSGIINYTSNANYVGMDSVIYQICDAICTNICDTATLYISVEQGIDITVPTGFTPNGDGINETLVIQGLSQHPKNTLLIYNRWGDLVFSAEPYNNDWNGQSEKALYGDRVVDGTYFYILTYEDASNEVIKLNGYVEVKSK